MSGNYKNKARCRSRHFFHENSLQNEKVHKLERENIITNYDIIATRSGRNLLTALHTTHSLQLALTVYGPKFIKFGENVGDP